MRITANCVGRPNIGRAATALGSSEMSYDHTTSRNILEADAEVGADPITGM